MGFLHLNVLLRIASTIQKGSLWFRYENGCSFIDCNMGRRKFRLSQPKNLERKVEVLRKVGRPSKKRKKAGNVVLGKF